MKTKNMKVQCPNCKKSFPLNEVLVRDFKMSIEQDFQKELSRKESEFNRKLEKARMEIREQVQNESNLSIMTKEKLICDLKEQLSKVRMKLENSSQQMTGEIQELAIEELLQKEFPTDSVEPIAKGKNGADCILHIMPKNNVQAGSILFESKRVSTFSERWINKLKDDNLRSKCQVMVIITSAMPKDIQGKYGLKDGVWICMFDPEAIRQLTLVLKFGLLKVFEMKSFQSISDGKAKKLIEYLSSPYYENQVERVQNGFHLLNESFQQEKNTLTKIWKIREQQLQETLTNTLEVFDTMDAIVRPTVAEIPTPGLRKAI